MTTESKKELGDQIAEAELAERIEEKPLRRASKRRSGFFACRQPCTTSLAFAVSEVTLAGFLNESTIGIHTNEQNNK